MSGLFASKPLWLWAALAFLLGSTVMIVVPEPWLFVSDETHAAHAATENKEIWACPMLCVRLDSPGECPVCGMDLEKLEDTGDALQLNERERALIDLATEPVERRTLTHEIRTFGRLEFNQRRIERISAWVPGRITRLYADTAYTDVREGEHLFEIYSPQLYAAQTEYLSARGGFGGGLRDAAREKLLLYGLTTPQIDALDAAGTASHTVVIHSPASGTISELMAKEGDYVKEGTPLYTIADYSTLWLLFDAYEADLVWLAAGQEVMISLDARPGKVFPGTIEFIDKAVSNETRTTKVRVVLDNPDNELQPGMFANVTVNATLGRNGRVAQPSLAGRYTCYMHPEIQLDAPGDCPVCGMAVELHAAAPAEGSSAKSSAATAAMVLSIPRTAVLDTGERQLVYVMTKPPEHVEESDGSWTEVSAPEFKAREVILGPRAGTYVAVVAGLAEGERVVTQGNFLIDSQMELLGKSSLLHPGGSDPSGTDPHAGH